MCEATGSHVRASTLPAAPDRASAGHRQALLAFLIARVARHCPLRRLQYLGTSWGEGPTGCVFFLFGFIFFFLFLAGGRTASSLGVWSFDRLVGPGGLGQGLRNQFPVIER